LLHLFETARAEGGGDESHGRGALSGGHILQADAAAGDESSGEIRPSFALLLVVEREGDGGALFVVEGGEKRIGGFHDAGGRGLGVGEA
jgi:hypothetical protein